MKHSINKITLSLLAVMVSHAAFSAPSQPSLPNQPTISEHNNLSLNYKGDLTGAVNNSNNSVNSGNIASIEKLLNTGTLHVHHITNDDVTMSYTPSIIDGGTVEHINVKNSSVITNVHFKGSSQIWVTGTAPAIVRNPTGTVTEGCSHGVLEDYATPLNKGNTYSNRTIEHVYSLDPKVNEPTPQVAVSEDGIFNDSSAQIVRENGVSRNTTFNDVSGQLVANGGLSKDATFNNKAQQIVKNATVFNTTFNNDSAQFLSNNSKATDTVLEDNAWQVVADTSEAHQSILNGNSVQLLDNSAKAYDTKLSNVSMQIVKNNAAAEKTQLDDTTMMILVDSATATDTTLADRAEMYVGEGTVATTTSAADNSYIRVEKNAKLEGKTTLGDNAWLALQADATQGAFAADITSADDAIITVLNGADRADSAYIGKLEGKALVKFEQESGKAQHGNLLIDHLNEATEHVTFKYAPTLIDDKTDFVTINNGTGKHYIHWLSRDTGVELINKPNTGVDFVTLNNGDANFRLIDDSKRELDFLDVGTYVYGLTTTEDAAGAKTWTLKSTGRLSPSTIAALNVAAAPQLIFQNEIQNLRYRMVTLKDAKQETGVWVRALGGRTEAKDQHLNFEVKQKGIEIGVDHGWRTDSGLLVAGVFGNTSKNDVDVKQGRTSNIDSYSLGSYLSYFDDSGLYVDGVFKYNSFDTDLKATSTNGYNVSGKYKTKALGASVELGYNLLQENGMWYEPYARLSYSQMSSKNYRLDNGMNVGLGKQKSMQGEAGVSIGHQFDLTAGTVMPYVKAAVVREFASNNKVTINDRYDFKNDLSGTRSKLGIGANIVLKSNISVFAEVDRQFSSKVKAPIQGNIGLRYSF